MPWGLRGGEPSTDGREAAADGSVECGRHGTRVTAEHPLENTLGSAQERQGGSERKKVDTVLPAMGLVVVRPRVDGDRPCLRIWPGEADRFGPH